MTPGDIEIVGPPGRARFGATVVVEDVNGDGAADLLIGAQLAARPATVGSEPGMLHVVHGPFVAGTRRDLSSEPAELRFIGRDARAGSARGDNLGMTVTTGLLNDDELPDLVLGVFGSSGSTGTCTSGGTKRSDA